MSPYDMALLSILSETKNLNLYFSNYERNELHRKLKEMKKNPGSKQLAEMIRSVRDNFHSMCIKHIDKINIA